MKKFTKLISLLCLAAAFVLASCSSPSSGGTGNGTGGGTGGTTYIGSKAPIEPKEVGDIVFNDGSATPYAEINERTTDPKITDAEKAAAIAVIFYVGTELNSDDDNGNPDNTTVRTLGVGLKHDNPGRVWCANNSVNGYSINITKIQCTPISGDKNGSDNYEQMAAVTGINDTNDLNNYPAFQFGKEYGTTNSLSAPYNEGWYLPSVAELNAIYNVKSTVDEASSLCGGSRFALDWYWSSSQYASDAKYASRLNFNSAECGFNSKIVKYYVCAVRAFN